MRYPNCLRFKYQRRYRAKQLINLVLYCAVIYGVWLTIYASTNVGILVMLISALCLHKTYISREEMDVFHTLNRRAWFHSFLLGSFDRIYRGPLVQSTPTTNLKPIAAFKWFHRPLKHMMLEYGIEENTLHLKTTRLDERFQGSVDAYYEYNCSNGWKIISGNRLSIVNKQISLSSYCGDYAKEFATANDLAECLSGLMPALTDWDSNWKGWTPLSMSRDRRQLRSKRFKRTTPSTVTDPNSVIELELVDLSDVIGVNVTKLNLNIEFDEIKVTAGNDELILKRVLKSGDEPVFSSFFNDNFDLTIYITPGILDEPIIDGIMEVIVPPNINKDVLADRIVALFSSVSNVIKARLLTEPVRRAYKF